MVQYTAYCLTGYLHYLSASVRHRSCVLNGSSCIVVCVCVYAWPGAARLDPFWWPEAAFPIPSPRHTRRHSLVRQSASASACVVDDVISSRVPYRPRDFTVASSNDKSKFRFEPYTIRRIGFARSTFTVFLDLFDRILRSFPSVDMCRLENRGLVCDFKHLLFCSILWRGFKGVLVYGYILQFRWVPLSLVKRLSRDFVNVITVVGLLISRPKMR